MHDIPLHWPNYTVAQTSITLTHSSKTLYTNSIFTNAFLYKCTHSKTNMHTYRGTCTQNVCLSTVCSVWLCNSHRTENEHGVRKSSLSFSLTLSLSYTHTEVHSYSTPSMLSNPLLPFSFVPLYSGDILFACWHRWFLHSPSLFFFFFAELVLLPWKLVTEPFLSVSLFFRNFNYFLEGGFFFKLCIIVRKMYTYSHKICVKTW